MERGEVGSRAVCGEVVGERIGVSEGWREGLERKDGEREDSVGRGVVSSDGSGCKRLTIPISRALWLISGNEACKPAPQQTPC